MVEKHLAPSLAQRKNLARPGLHSSLGNGFVGPVIRPLFEKNGALVDWSLLTRLSAKGNCTPPETQTTAPPAEGPDALCHTSPMSIMPIESKAAVLFHHLPREMLRVHSPKKLNKLQPGTSQLLIQMSLRPAAHRPDLLKECLAY